MTPLANFHLDDYSKTTYVILVLDHNLRLIKNLTMERNRLLRMDNVGIVVESLDSAIAFFTEIGLTLEGRGFIEGEWAGRVTGLGNQRVEVAMMVTPDGHSRLEISRFERPATIADHRTAPVNALGYLRVMFTVSNVDEMVARLTRHGAQLVGELFNRSQFNNF